MSHFIASSHSSHARASARGRTARALDGRGPECHNSLPHRNVSKCARASARAEPRPRSQIFSIAPEAKGLFPFSRGRQSDEDLYNNLYLKKHGANVVMTVNTAVNGLSDLDALVPVLQGLGKRHVAYGVLPPHYGVVGQALIATLGAALGDAFTDDVKTAWLAVYGIVQTTMIGDNYDAEGQPKVEEAVSASEDEQTPLTHKRELDDVDLDEPKDEAVAGFSLWRIVECFAKRAKTK